MHLADLDRNAYFNLEMTIVPAVFVTLANEHVYKKKEHIKTKEHAISGEIVRVCLFASVAGGSVPLSFSLLVIFSSI